MLLTAPVWTDGKTPKVTSRFLLEVLEADPALPVARLQWADLPDPARPAEAVNPTAASSVSVLWPADPLAHRRAALAAGAEAVRAAIAGQAAGSQAVPLVAEQGRFVEASRMRL